MNLDRIEYVTDCEECGKLTRLTETAYNEIVKIFNEEIKALKMNNSALRCEVNELKYILAINGI